MKGEYFVVEQKTIYASPTQQISPKIWKHVLAPPPPYKSWTCPSNIP